MMFMKQITVAILILFTLAPWATAQVRIKELCDVKGQEPLMLRGVGLVVGLSGTGDPDLPATMRALARSLSGSGLEVPKDALGQELTEEFLGSQNVALVFVTAEVPAAGARQGTRTVCRVDSFGSAQSIQGGRLLHASLTTGPFGGEAGQMRVFATASGEIRLDDPLHTVSGLIDDGCQFEFDFKHSFTYLAAPKIKAEGKEFNPFPQQPSIPTTRQEPPTRKSQLYFDLVIRNEHASFGTASEIAETLRSYQDYDLSELEPTALDQITIQVPVLDAYRSDPVDFIHQILELEVLTKPKSTTVVINRKKGTVIIGDEVRFDPVAISSGDFAVDTGPVQTLDLESVAPLGNENNFELTRLQQSLAALQAPPETLIDIIEGLEKGGKLYGKVIYID